MFAPQSAQWPNTISAWIRLSQQLVAIYVRGAAQYPTRWCPQGDGCRFPLRVEHYCILRLSWPQQLRATTHIVLTLRVKLGSVSQRHVLPLHHQSNSHIVWLLRSHALIDQTLLCKLQGCLMIHAVPSAAHRERPDGFSFHVFRSTPSDPHWFNWLPRIGIHLCKFLQKVFHETWHHHVVICQLQDVP